VGHDEFEHYLTSHETLIYQCNGGQCRCDDLITGEELKKEENSEN